MINSQPGSPQRTATFIAIFVGIVWAIFVVVRYLGVDDNFLFNLILVPVSNKRILAGVLLFLACTLFGYTSGQNHRRKIIIGALSLIAISVIALILHSTIQSAWLKVDNLPDGARASLVLAVAALVGVGIGVGTRISHRPVTLGFLAACLFLPFLFTALRAGATASLLAVGWLFLAADALGMIVLTWLNRFIKTPSAIINRAGLLSIAVGLGILVLGTLGLGLVGGTSTTGILLGLLLLTVLCFAQIKSNLMRLVDLPWRQPILLSEFEMGGLFILAALFLIYWIGTLAPEVGADALGFRIAAPAIWLRDGIIRPLPEMLGSYGFFAGEMIYLLVMPLTGFNAAKIVQFGLALLLVLSAFMQVFEKSHRKEASLLLFAFWGCTLVWWQMIWGWVDLSQMFFYFACILALRFWLDEPKSPVWLIVAGIAGATATTIKLNGAGALVIAGLVVVSVTLYHTRSLAKVIKNSLYLGIPAVICLLPWLIRSNLLTKNPLFPFANQFFNSPLILSMPVANFGVGLSFPDVLSVPWGIFFDPARFGSLGTYHPLILASALLGTIGLLWASSRKDWLWLGAGTLAYIFWLVTEQNSRYSLFAIYFLMLAFGIGLLKLQDRFPGRIQRGIFQLLLLIGLIWGFGMQACRPSFWMRGNVSGPTFPTQVVLGSQSKSDYLTVYVPTYLCAEWLNRCYGQKAKIFEVPPTRDHLYFSAPAFALPQGILPETRFLDAILINPELIENHSAIYQGLVAAGYTHLLFVTTLSRWTKTTIESERQGLFSSAFENTYMQLECADRGLRLYKLLPIPLRAITPHNVGPDLLVNGGFDVVDARGLPGKWNLSGQGKVVKSSGNTTLILEENATLTQPVTVGEGHLYELIVDYKAPTSGGSGNIQINWLDASGQQLRLFWRESVTPSAVFHTYRFFQTAPSRTYQAVIYLNGPVQVQRVSFRELGGHNILPSVAPLKLLALFPPNARRGQGFNIQPDGTSALSVTAEKVTLDTVIVFNGEQLLGTVCSPDMKSVAALVPAKLYSQPGQYKVYLKNSNGESNRLLFIVNP